MIVLKKILILLSITLVCLGTLFWTSKNHYKHKKIARLHRCQPESLSVLEISAIVGNKRILLFGDSRIQGWGQPDFGKNVAIINMGAGGATTGEALCRIDNAFLRLDPEWSIIQLGINDLVAASMMSKDMRLKAQEKTLYNLKSIVRKLTSMSSNVLVLTIVPPISPNIIKRLVWGKEISEATEKLSDALMTELPHTVKVYNMKKTFFDYNHNTWKTNYSTDALHWNKEAYAALTIEIKKIISK